MYKVEKTVEIFYTPENNHGCSGHVVKIKTSSEYTGIVVSETSCCAQSGCCKYEIGDQVASPVIWGLATKRDNYGNTFMDPDDLVTGARYAEKIRETYLGELERYQKKQGMRWNPNYA